MPSSGPQGAFQRFWEKYVPNEQRTQELRTRCEDAFHLGVRDGREQPYDLTSGMTYPSPTLNEAYDSGVNYGQAAAKGGR